MTHCNKCLRFNRFKWMKDRIESVYENEDWCVDYCSRKDIKFHSFYSGFPIDSNGLKNWIFATFFHLRIIKTFFKRKKNRASRVKMKSFYDLCHTVICVCHFDGFIKLLFFAQSSWGFQICWQMHYTHLYFIVWHWYCQNILCSFQSSKFIFTVCCHF